MPEIPPSQTRVVPFGIPAEADLSSGARVSLDAVPKEKNTANNALAITVSRRHGASVRDVQSAGIERLDTDQEGHFARLRN